MFVAFVYMFRDFLDLKKCLTGVVSGGRGPLGLCGGINNPVHYVR